MVFKKGHEKYKPHACGPKKKQLDERQIKELANMQCTMSEIAAVMGVSVDTLERRYAEVIRCGREFGKASLRRVQFKKALDGNTALLIWLGKHYLNQKDEIHLSTTEPEVRQLISKWETDAATRTRKAKKDFVVTPKDGETSQQAAA